MSEQPDKETLLKWAQAQLDANRLQQDANNIERRKQAISLQVIEAAQHLAQEVRLFLHEIRLSREAQQKQAVWQDRVFEDLANRIERLERNQVLMLTENNPQKRTAASQDLEQELGVRKELKKRYGNLNKLERQAAEYGELDVPLKLSNSIEAERERIAELEEKLT